MPNRPASIAGLVRRESLLAVTGLRKDSQATPTGMECPLCKQGEARWQHDGILNSEWVSCEACGFAGDVIELSAALWGLSAPEAIQELQRQGCLPAIETSAVDAYVEHHLSLRRRVRSFWQKASADLPNNRTLAVRNLCYELGIEEVLDRPVWQTSGCRWIGSTTRQAVEDLFHPASYQTTDRMNRDGRSTPRRGSGPGANRLFVGEGWDQMMVLPFQDLPGRICGLLIVGRAGNLQAGDVIYRSLPLGASTDVPHEAGMLMLDTLSLRPETRWGGKFFACGDPLLALRMQAEHLRDGSQPLQIVATWRDDKSASRRVWQNLPARQFICFGELCDGRVIQNALDADTDVGCFENTQRPLSKHPMQRLYQVKRSARPVLETLCRELNRLDVSRARALFRPLVLTPGQRHHFQEIAGESLLARCGDDSLVRRVKVGAKTITESEHGWFLEPGGRQITNGVVRIQEIATVETDRQLVSGSVRLADVTCPFVLTLAEVDRRGLLPVIRDKLLAQKAAVLVYDRSWSRLAWDVAIAFQQPQFVAQRHRVGWNDEAHAFLFPSFRIERGGRVDVAPNTVISDGPVPFANLLPPCERLYVSLVEPRSPKSEVSHFWALVACILHNLLAPALRRPRMGVLLEGRATQEICRALVTALGCLRLDIPTRRSGPDLEGWLDSQASAHDVPPMFDFAGGRGRQGLDCWLTSLGEKNCILPVDWWSARSLSTQRRWHVLRTDQTVPRNWSPRVVDTDIIPAYLRDLARRSFALPPSNQPLLMQILNDLAEWYGEQGGRSANVRSARTVLNIASATRPADEFLQLLEAVRDLPHTSRVDKAVSKADQAFVLSTLAFDELLGEFHAPPLDWPAIEAELQPQVAAFAVAALQVAKDDLLPIPIVGREDEGIVGPELQFARFAERGEVQPVARVARPARLVLRATHSRQHDDSHARIGERPEMTHRRIDRAALVTMLARRLNPLDVVQHDQPRAF